MKKLSDCRVLIVDDNVDSAVSLAMLLQLHRHEVNVAHDGREALEAAGVRVRSVFVRSDFET